MDLHRNIKFSHRIFFKPHLHYLKRTNLAISRTFLPSAMRHSPKQRPRKPVISMETHQCPFLVHFQRNTPLRRRGRWSKWSAQSIKIRGIDKTNSVSSPRMTEIFDSKKYGPEINDWIHGPEINDFGESKKHAYMTGCQ